MTVEVQPIASEDFDAVVALWESLLANGFARDSRFKPTDKAREAFEPIARDVWFQTEPFVHTWVAKLDRRVVGFLHGARSPWSPVIDTPPTAIIRDTYVVADVRGQQIGRRLVGAFTNGARSAGCERIEVGTLAQDEDAVAFWRACGFGDWRVILARDSL